MKMFDTKKSEPVGPVGAVIVSHGHLAVELVATAEMIGGPMPHVTAASIDWALTKAEAGYYPLTWLSHELDVTLWGVKPGAHLLTNVLFHAITACLLFFALVMLFGREDLGPRGRAAIPSTAGPAGNRTHVYVAAFTAALFAVHPMHVESVAWASERKDTLSTLFIVVGLLLYARAPHRKLDVVLAMAASLAAKQMYMTFPFVLLLLDY